MLSGEAGRVARGLWLLVALILGAAWLFGFVLLPPSTPLVAKARQAIPAFTGLRTDQLTLEGTGSAEDKDRLRDRLIGRLALHRIDAGSSIDPAIDVGLPVADVPQGAGVVVLRAADPLGTLRAGDVIDVVLVPEPAVATPIALEATGGRAALQGQDAGRLGEVLVLRVGQQGPDGTVAVLVAVPTADEQIDKLEQFVGRAVAHPLYLGN